MNLHGIVSRAVGAINPFIEAQIFKSTGSVKSADYSRVPDYADPVPMMVQKQAVTQGDIRHLDNLNIQGCSLRFIPMAIGAASIARKIRAVISS
ncbi:hypothetical protein SODG_000047 [Sodalis praecaptivus]